VNDTATLEAALNRYLFGKIDVFYIAVVIGVVGNLSLIFAPSA
jgi:hypothetical protein